MNSVPVLTSCSYCGCNMSSELNKCPHCGKMVPQIVRCRVCEQELGDRYSIDLHNESFFETSSGFFHLNCLEAASKCFCSVCNRKITVEELSKTTSHQGTRCPECGHLSFVTPCSTCGGYMPSGDGIKGLTYQRHHHCHEKMLALAKEQSKDYRRKRICPLCKKKLNLILWLFGSKTHSECSERDGRYDGYS